MEPSIRLESRASLTAGVRLFTAGLLVAILLVAGVLPGAFPP